MTQEMTGAEMVIRALACSPETHTPGHLSAEASLAT